MEENSLFSYILPKVVIKYFKLANLVDHDITNNIKDSGFVTRPAKGNGLWCFALIPTILITFAMSYNVSPVYRVVAFLSLGILFYCFLFTIFISISSLVLKESNNGGFIASSMISALILYTVLERGFIFSLVSSYTTVYAFIWLLRECITNCPNTFTLGEAMVVSQSIVLSSVAAVVKLMYKYDARIEADFNSFVVVTALSTVALVVAVLSFLQDTEQNLTYCMPLTLLAGAALALVVLHVVLGITFTVHFVSNVFLNSVRLKLLGLWLLLVVISITLLYFRTTSGRKADTVTRKSFHILASLVFLSGILSDVEFMKLVAGGGLGLLILIEALRKLNIEPLSKHLDAAFLIYSDEKDCGSFAMTPIYLYTGLASGLALSPYECRLELLGGVLGVGIGDTCASWMGKRFGVNKWSGSERTVEGTVFNIISQILTIYALQLCGVWFGKHALFRTMVAATASGLVESKTDQVDNLVIPLINIIAFQGTSFLA